MKVGIYGRISTTDKHQNVETQLLALRDKCEAEGWQIFEEYVDEASAIDIAHRPGWKQLMDDATKRRFQVVLVFKLDRAFRSVKHMHDCLEVWQSLGIGFKSLREGFDTETPLGRLLLNLLASLAEFELELIRERVRAGMDRARRQGKKIGRPRVIDKRGFKTRFKAVLVRLNNGELSRRRAAKELNVGYATLKRLLDATDSPAGT
ncbi:recombinase family protein [Chloroflexota bacterium]